MVNTLDFITKKYNIEVGHQQIIDIPNMNRDDLASLFGELNFKLGAEIGVERGYFSETLCKSNPGLNLNCIDPWMVEAYEPNVHGVDPEQEKYNQRFIETTERLKPYNCNILRLTSLNALSSFPNNSLDFVYIDANHDFPNFINDLHNWIKKVRPGGIVAGHDYANFPFRKHNHVKRALNAYAKSYQMIPLFIVGRYEQIKGEKRDKYRSWFWVKDVK